MKRLLIYITLLFLTFLSYSQTTIKLQKVKNSISVENFASNNSIFTFSYASVQLIEVETSDDIYTQIIIPDTYRSGKIGEPQLLSSNKLISIPWNAALNLVIVDYSMQEFNLNDYGFEHSIIPIQAPVSKSIELSEAEFVKDEMAYARNSFSDDTLASVKILGNLRDKKIAKISIHPVQYNPVLNTIRVYNNIKVEISFSINKKNKTNQKGLKSNDFDAVYEQIISLEPAQTKYADHPDLENEFVKYLVISPSEFQNTLEPLISWKKQKGFRVEIATTDVIGFTASEIKAWIHNQYLQASDTNPAPSYLLLVGDVQQIPASQNGSSTGLATDLYYASVDGDMFPDMYYGRISAQDTLQLQIMLDKILLYEKYEFPDDSFLDDVTLIAGADATYNVRVGQPTVKYGTDNYFNTANGFNNVNDYLSTYTDCYNSDKVGVSMINYTAHCGQTSWGNPYLSVSSVQQFSNDGKYPIAIGNCCQSGDFSINECIGEAWVRQPNGGAVAYIGSVPETFWWEDFYWAVGAHSPVYNEYPSVDSSSLGVFDAPFSSDYYSSDAFVFVGNLAVTEAHDENYNSDVNSLYYWEAYHCLGDPSLQPYFKKGLENTVSHATSLPSGIGFFEVEAEPNSLVVLSANNELMAAAKANQEGLAELIFNPVFDLDSVDLVITKPKYKAIIEKIPVSQVEASYLVLSDILINDENQLLDYNDSVSLTLLVENIGETTAHFVNAKVETSDYFVKSIVNNDLINFGDIASNEVYSLANQFVIQLKDSIPDQYEIEFEITLSDSISGEARISYTYTKKIKVQAPLLQLLETYQIDDFESNGNQTLDLDETANLRVSFANTGHSMVSSTVYISNISSNKNIDIINEVLPVEMIAGGDTINVDIALKAHADANWLDVDTIQVVLAANAYADTNSFALTIGQEYSHELGNQAFEIENYPFNNYYKNNKTQLLFSQAEIGQGIKAIKSVAFNISAATLNAAYRDLSSFEIRLQETDLANLSEFVDMSDDQLCYEPKTYNLSGNEGWDTIVFDSAFIISENKNLLVQVSWGLIDTNAPESDRTLVFGSETNFSSVFAGFSNTQNPPDLISVSSIRPDVRLEFDTVAILTGNVLADNYINESEVISEQTFTINSQNYKTNNNGEFKYLSLNQTESLEFDINIYGYRDTTFSYTKNSVYDNLTIELQRNPQLKVTVLTSTNLPVGLATVSIGGLNFFTNSEGVVEIYLLQSGQNDSLTIHKDGYTDKKLFVEITNENKDITINLSNDYADVSFKIMNSKNENLSNALIILDGNAAYSDNLGVAKFEDIINGSHELFIHKPAYVYIEDTLEINILDTVIIYQLATIGTVTVKVRNKFTSLENARVICDNDTVLTNSLGLATFTNSIEGDYAIKIDNDGHFNLSDSISVFGDSDFEFVLSEIPDLTFYIHNGSIGIEDVQVEFNYDQKLTNSNGLAVFEDVPNGEFIYQISKDSYYSIEDSITVFNLDSNINIQLFEIPDLTFIFTDSSGYAENITVEVNNETYISDESGQFSIIDIGKEKISYSISKPGYFSLTDTLTLLQNDTILYVFLNEIPDVQFIVESNKQAIDSAFIEIGDTTGYSSIIGNFILENIQPGNYPWQITKEGYFNASGNIQVDSANILVTVNLIEKPDVYIVVTNGVNMIENARVTLNSTEVITDATGTAHFRDLNYGEFAYTVAMDGYFESSGSISLSELDVHEYVMLHLEQYEVAFTVSNSANKIDSAQIQFNSEINFTDSTGIAVFDSVLVGNHSYSIFKDGFVEQTGFVGVSNANVDVSLELELTSYAVTFHVIDDNGNLSGASIHFNNQTKTTNSSGIAQFADVIPADSLMFIVRKWETHYSDTGYVNVTMDTSVQVHLDFLVGIDQVIQSFVTVYPNPTQKEFVLNTSGMEQALKFELINTKGELILEQKILSKSQNVNVSNIAKGTYILRIIFENQIIKKTIVVE
ncbi:MAG: T9SS type A sorting domain-containing protein [Salinivirgaceae bacterium]|nr:T9SS type A sorting domain-containing protein [Salinivirgaceae bacterium]